MFREQLLFVLEMFEVVFIACVTTGPKKRLELLKIRTYDLHIRKAAPPLSEPLFHSVAEIFKV